MLRTVLRLVFALILIGVSNWLIANDAVAQVSCPAHQSANGQGPFTVNRLRISPAILPGITLPGCIAANNDPDSFLLSSAADVSEFSLWLTGPDNDGESYRGEVRVRAEAGPNELTLSSLTCPGAIISVVAT
ncbi:MAG: hypothetical protein AAFO75_01915, partial [Pseudomonadota bacterium]